MSQLPKTDHAEEQFCAQNKIHCITNKNYHVDLLPVVPVLGSGVVDDEPPCTSFSNLRSMVEIPTRKLVGVSSAFVSKSEAARGFEQHRCFESQFLH